MKLLHGNEFKLIVIIILGLAIRLVLNNRVYSFDAESFPVWGMYLTKHSLVDLYTNLPGSYPPYPPVYYYVLMILGLISNLLKLWNHPWLFHLVFKAPVFVAEIITTLIIYYFSKKYVTKEKPYLSAAIFFLNPAIIYISALWGQIDSIIIFFALYFVYLISSKNYFFSFFILLIGALTKLQTLAVFPILLTVRLPISKLLKYGLFLIVISLLIFLPIIIEKDIVWVAKYFKQLPNQYPYTSIYAYNLWSVRGFIVSDKTKLLSWIEYRYLGLMLYFLISMCIVIPMRLSKWSNQVLIFSFVLLFYSFAYFSTRIHSRYFVYCLPFASIFVTKYPLQFIALNIFVILNLMLPLNSHLLEPFVLVLNDKNVIIAITLTGFFIFLSFIHIYRGLLMENK